jgi:predicted RNA binding protein YcfA (HicA-like mRNA interferase family)
MYLNKRKLLDKIQNSSKNIRFDEFKSLIKAFGFRLIRTTGSHHIYENTNVLEMVNIQEEKGKAKPYQIQQFFSLVEKYNLKMEGEND